MAASKGHTECVELLIPVSNPKIDNSYPLRIAIVYGHTDCALLLIPFSEPKFGNSEALFLAVQQGSVECVKSLLPVSEPQLSNPRSFYLALGLGHAAIVELMISNEPGLLDLIDTRPAWRDALTSGHHELAELLLAADEQRSLAKISRKDAPRLPQKTNTPPRL